MLLSNGTYNCSGVRDEKYDRLVEASDVETDPVKRNALLHEAEQWAVGEQFYICLLYTSPVDSKSSGNSAPVLLKNSALPSHQSDNETLPDLFSLGKEDFSSERRFISSGMTVLRLAA